MKSTVSKMIPFKQRESNEKHKNSKYRINKANVINTSKVIPYPKYKKRKEKGIKLIKNNKPLLMILCLLLFFILLAFIDNVVLKDKYDSNKKPIKSGLSTSDTSVSEIEFEASSKVIENKIKNTLSLSGNYFIDIRPMHKNGNLIYSQGNISVGKDETKYFDIILKDKVPYSLVIDGTEYIK